MISSYFVGSSTGTSAGFAPLRIHVHGELTEDLDGVRSIAHECPGLGEVLKVGQEGEPGPQRQFHDFLPLARQHRVGEHEHGIQPLTCGHGEGVVDLAWGSRFEHSRLHLQGLGGQGHAVALGHARQILWIPEDAHARGDGHSLLENLQTLGIETGRQATDARQVATRAAETRHEPGLDGVSGKEHDGNRPGCGLCGKRGRRAAGGEDQVHLEAHQLRRHSGKPLVSALGPPGLDDEIPAFGITQIVELLSEGLQLRLEHGRRLNRQEPDPVDLCRLLRLRAEGQREETGEGEKLGAAREHWQTLLQGPRSAQVTASDCRRAPR